MAFPILLLLPLNYFVTVLETFRIIDLLYPTVTQLCLGFNYFLVMLLQYFKKIFMINLFSLVSFPAKHPHSMMHGSGLFSFCIHLFVQMLIGPSVVWKELDFSGLLLGSFSVNNAKRALFLKVATFTATVAFLMNYYLKMAKKLLKVNIVYFNSPFH